MILDGLSDFLNKVHKHLDEKGIDVSKFELDHFAYQASSDSDYDILKEQFIKLGEEVSEAIVGGRRVGIFKLNEPIAYKDKSISAIELIAPVEGKTPPSGLEHIEYVIDEDFLVFADRYPTLDWNKTKINRDEFPMLILDLGDNTTVKFHHKNVLDMVVEQEG